MKDKQVNQNLLDWLGFKQKIAFASHPFIGHLIACFLILIGAALLLGGAMTIIQFVAVVLAFEGDHEAIRNIGLVVAAVIGAPFVVWRALVAQKQADTAEQSHITDQINKAVAGLGAERTVDRIGRSLKIVGEYRDIETERTEIEWQGKPLVLNAAEKVTERGDWQVFSETLPNLEVRIGSIYALERIAQDSHRDHIQIMEILTAYIRENAPVGEVQARFILETWPQPRTDIQAAIDVIGRRTVEQVKIEWEKKYRLDLHAANLSGANFTGGKFEGALFHFSNLEDCWFKKASLKAVRMVSCQLNSADFHEADLTGAILDNSTIAVPDRSVPSFSSATNLEGISLARADISSVNFPIGDMSLIQTFGTEDTKLNESAEEARQKCLEDMRAFERLLQNGKIPDEEGVRDRLTKAGFLYWSPYAHYDPRSKFLREKLWDHLGLKGFPFED